MFFTCASTFCKNYKNIKKRILGLFLSCTLTQIQCCAGSLSSCSSLPLSIWVRTSYDWPHRKYLSMYLCLFCAALPPPPCLMQQHAAIAAGAKKMRRCLIFHTHIGTHIHTHTSCTLLARSTLYRSLWVQRHWQRCSHCCRCWRPPHIQI